MGHKYVWQKSDWTQWRWQSDELLSLLGQARKAQGQIIAQANFIGLEAQADIVIEEAIKTSAIEGEKLDHESVRSSVARRLGLPTAGLIKVERSVDGLVEMLLDATTNFSKPLDAKRMYQWHAALFPVGYSGMQKISVGSWRQGDEPMQVVSGGFGKEKIHFEAVPTKTVPTEMKKFIHWWNHPEKNLDGMIRAGLAHFWFVTIHPFDDGNGRIARVLTDMALAQDEKTGRRLYSLSAQIHRERKGYYDMLEKCQRSSCDITEWLAWFFGVFVRSVEGSQSIIQKALTIVQFWQKHRDLGLNPRQLKAIRRMLEAGKGGFEGGLTNRKYVGMNKVSRETAKRDLAELEHLGVLKRNTGRGRSVSYELLY